MDDKHTFASGASSSGRLPAFHLIPWRIFSTRLANRYSLGALKYGEGNWEKGLSDRDFVLDRANHMLDHAHRAVEAMRLGLITTDDDLAAVIWGAICLMAAQEISQCAKQEASSSMGQTGVELLSTYPSNPVPSPNKTPGGTPSTRLSQPLGEKRSTGY